MSIHDSIGAGRSGNGAITININSLPKNLIDNDLVNNSDFVYPKLMAVRNGHYNDRPMSVNAKIQLPHNLKPNEFNRYNKITNSSFSYPKMTKYSQSNSNIQVNPEVEVQIRQKLIDKINVILPRVDILFKTASNIDNKNILESMKSILTSMSVSLLYNEENQQDIDKVDKIEKWIKQYVLWLNGGTIPDPFIIPTTFIKGIVAPTTGTPTSGLATSTTSKQAKVLLDKYIKDIKKLNLKELEDLYNKSTTRPEYIPYILSEMVSRPTPSSSTPSSSTPSTPTTTKLPLSMKEFIEDIKLLSLTELEDMYKDPKTPASKKKLIRLELDDRSLTASLPLKPATGTVSPAKVLPPSTPAPPIPAVKDPDEEKEDLPSKTLWQKKDVGKMTLSTYNNIPLGSEALLIQEQAMKYGLVDKTFKINRRISFLDEYTLIIPTESQTYLEISSNNELPLIITKTFFSTISDKEDFLRSLGKVYNYKYVNDDKKTKSTMLIGTLKQYLTEASKPESHLILNNKDSTVYYRKTWVV